MNNPAAQRIVERLRKNGHTALYAGGCVRDHLLGKPSKDIDIATSATPDEVQSIFPRVTGLEGKCYGVVRVLEDHQIFEVAMFRTDGEYIDGRRPESVQKSTPEEDAKRRDFTVNGMFYDPITQEIIDYVGGREDLQKKIIRTIGNPEDRFREDKLRLLRAIRFATKLDFQIEPKTFETIQKLSSEVTTVAIERVRDELDKIWTSPHPDRGLTLLDESGLLQPILPEVHGLHGVEQPPQFHPEGDVFIHTRIMLSMLKDPPLPVALAVLFHDIGKKPTSRVDVTGRIRFNGHESVGAKMTLKILERMRYSNEIIDEVVLAVQNHMAFKDVPKMRVSKLKRFLGRPTLENEMELHRVDCLSSHGDLSVFEFIRQKQREIPAEEIKPPRLVNGNDLIEIGARPGKILGDLLRLVEDAQLEGQLKTKEEALAFAKEKIHQN
ncbi:MAG: CCA tRNA nucleotidyltransferase [Verrucomicrobiota bacterium]